MSSGNNPVEKYVGLTANTFKERYGGHKADLVKSEGRRNTTLAGHLWKLKDKQTDYDINWEVVCNAAPFSPVTGVCNLCTSEKWHIILTKKMPHSTARNF